MTADSKDTIYIDVDEEITGIISKIQNSDKDIVALVLPKRASVLQSIVNMKLLKRAQDQHKKKVVLITSESRILPLAGAASLFVASNLTSKPYVPLAKVTGKETADGEKDDIDPNTPVSQVVPAAKFADSDDEIEIDNTPKTPEPGSETAKSKKNKKNKVPNFSKFRKKMIFAGALGVALVFVLIYAIFIAPKAKVTVKAQTTDLPMTIDFIADTSADSFDPDLKIVRATTKEDQKDDNEKVNTSGEKDKGDKATGTVTFKNCDFGSGATTLPAGTIVSADGFSFLTQKAVKLPADSFTGGACTSATASGSVTAQKSGEDYNLGAQSYAVSGYSEVQASGSQMSGGSSKIVKVVAQEDVDKAKERLNGKPSDVHDDFVNQLKSDGYVPIEDSFKSKPGSYDVSPAVGQEADEVTVSVTTKYSMLGIKKEDLQELVKSEVAKSEEGKDKTILSDGIDSATFKVSDDSGRIGVTMNTTVVVGPDLDQENIKSQIAGKKSGEAEAILSQVPGINEPKVELSPFWVGKVPKKHSKITIEVQQADGSQIP